MTSVTVDLNELRTLLNRVTPFAGDAGSMPVIASVYLQGRGNHLIATATDRYVVGMSRLFVDGVDGILNPPAAEKPNPATKSRARRAKAKVA
mgnify:CR=1 FL=1